MERTCRMCGNAFETDVSNKIYCSPACSKEAHRLKSIARSRERDARNAERRKAEKAARKATKAAAKAAKEAELKKLPLRERMIRKWGGVEKYEAHLAYCKRYKELRKAGRPTMRESIEAARREYVDDVDLTAPVCDVCGAPLSKIQIAHSSRYCSKNCAARAREAGWRQTGTKPGAPSDPIVRACSVCGSEIGDEPGDLCCLCSRAVDRENATQAAQSEAPWLVLMTRYCHDCGTPCNGYRCPDCLRKWREEHGVNLGDTFEESV